MMNRSRPPVLAHVEYQKHSAKLRELELQQKFEYIYNENVWGSPESSQDSAPRWRLLLQFAISLRNSAAASRYEGSQTRPVKIFFGYPLLRSRSIPLWESTSSSLLLQC